jgi:hypothetical protein
MSNPEFIAPELALQAMRRAVRLALAEKGPDLFFEMENGAVVALQVKRLSGLVSDGLAQEIVADALTRAGLSVRFATPAEANRHELNDSSSEDEHSS